MLERVIKSSKNIRKKGRIGLAAGFLGLSAIITGCNSGDAISVVETGSYLTRCREITSPGNYTVSNNLSGTAPNACLNIHDVSDVYVDCHKKNLTVPGLITGQAVVKLNNVNNFSLKNCFLQLADVPNAELPQLLSISNSYNGIISDNIFSGGGLINVGHSSNLKILKNIFDKSAYQQIMSNNNRIENNSFDWDYSGAGLIVSIEGYENAIKNNSIDGHGTRRITAEYLGFDDGIIIDTENRDTISGNTLQNFWDCAIETVGLIQNSVIADNRIKNAAYCGIGGWYWNSWKGNTVTGNSVDSSGTLFTFYRIFDLLPEEDFVYFSDNTFTENILTSQNNARGYSTDIEMSHSIFSEITDDKFKSTNNTYTSNDFDTGPGPYISPRSSIIDGGGNKCGPPSLGQIMSPLVCN